MRVTPASAEIIGLKALEWLAQEDDLLMTFLSSSGADINDVKVGAKDPAFLGSVLDFILMDDEWVKGFCMAETMEFTDPYMARQALPGGDLPNWT
tara:strand:- start:23621 stop:23905 length:285 start_codon:yes stop_codon:yes gene_type:complete